MQPLERCETCEDRISCLTQEKVCRAVSLVMEMILGDYIGVYEDNSDPDDVRLFKKGCEIICCRFDLDINKLDPEGRIW